MVKITALGCMHGHYPELERGDLLILTGDFTANNSVSAEISFFMWLKKQKYKKKILISGNHDNEMPKNHKESEDYIYLCDSGLEFEGLKIWGSPWSLWFDGINPHCTAFTGTEEDLDKKFSLIPYDIDILITHSPPFGILDLTARSKQNVGSKALLKQYDRIKPKLHLFSHIHEGWGYRDKFFTEFFNCSIMNEDYEAINEPFDIEI